MKFTSEDLMKAMGLQVGDNVKVIYADNVYITYELKYNEHEGLVLENDTDIELLSNIVNMDFEILPRPKRVGDLKCEDFDCKTCPLMCVCSWDSDFKRGTLFDVFNYELKTVHNDQEIYDLLKARLDKEVE